MYLYLWCPPEGDSQLWLTEKYYNNNFAIENWVTSVGDAGSHLWVGWQFVGEVGWHVWVGWQMWVKLGENWSGVTFVKLGGICGCNKPPCASWLSSAINNFLKVISKLSHNLLMTFRDLYIKTDCTITIGISTNPHVPFNKALRVIFLSTSFEGQVVTFW